MKETPVDPLIDALFKQQLPAQTTRRVIPFDNLSPPMYTLFAFYISTREKK